MTIRTKKELSAMTVTDLREELRGRGLKVSGVKQELVDRLVSHFRSSKAQAPATKSAPVEQAAVQAQVPAPQPMDVVPAPELIEAAAQPPADIMQESEPQSTLVDRVFSDLPAAEAAIDKVAITSQALETAAKLARVSEAPVGMPQEAPHEVIADKQSNFDVQEDSSESQTGPKTSAPEQPADPALTQKQSNLNVQEDSGESQAGPPKTTAPEQAAEPAPAEKQGRIGAPARRPRRVSRVPLSPTALLAPEVGGTPSKDATPVKAAQQSWRDDCAKEAACLRMGYQYLKNRPDAGDSSEGSDRGDSPDSRSASESSEQDTPASPMASREESNVDAGARARSPMSRSRSPMFETADPTPRSKVVLRKRRSLLQKESSLARDCSPLARKDVSTFKQNSEYQWRRPSRSRSPLPRRLTATPKNCLFACTSSAYNGTPTSKAGSAAKDQMVHATPEQDRARARAEELRAVLLRSRSKAGLVTADSAEGPGAFVTPRAALPSPAPAASPQMPAESPAPSPRNLSWSLDDAASGANKSQVVDGQKRMLEKLTQQMQLCLARLQDKQLDDVRRERYQELASSIQSQVDKISHIRSAAATQTLTRGGC